jgi:hypothetical protein
VGDPSSPGQSATTPALGAARKVYVKTHKERAEERRREKLEQIQDQVDKGQLTIRQMTPEERAAHPPRRREPKNPRR